MRKTLFIIVLAVANISFAQVGIGTTSPSPNAVLDLTSTSKGLMLPRVNDTTNVLNPTAGLMIFNKKTNTPAVHNGVNWGSLVSNMALSAASSADSLTYSASISGFSGSIFPLTGISTFVTNPGGPTSSYDGVSLVKKTDANSIPFLKLASLASATGLTSGNSEQSFTGSSNVMMSGIITINFFVKGTTSPYYTLKLTNCRVLVYQISNGSESSKFDENIVIKAVTYGFRDWTNNLTFAWNTSTNTEVAY